MNPESTFPIHRNPQNGRTFSVALLPLFGMLIQPSPHASAQSAAQLDIYLLPGMNVKSTTSSFHTVQYTSTPEIANSWRDLSNIFVPTSGVWVADISATATPQRFYRAVVQPPPTNVPANMVWISPGTFTMGSPTNEAGRWSGEGPLTTVTLTRGFFMGKYEVTQAEYQAVTGMLPSAFRTGRVGLYGGTGSAVTNSSRHPVEGVTWYDAWSYCHWLTESERRTGRLPSGWAYRLPTEAEWEYACRAGTATAFHFGNSLRSGTINYDGRWEYDSVNGSKIIQGGLYLGRTTEVGSYEPNAWGLYDMHGNVSEWCLDVWSDSLPGGNTTDPKGPDAGPYRIMRGGSWFPSEAPETCRSAFRIRRPYFDSSYAGTQNSTIGFRVVLAPAAK